MPATQSGSLTRCVVWHPRGVGVAPELASALSRRGIQWTSVEGGMLALARLCVAARAKEKSILLVVEPRAQPELGAVGEAAGRYAGDALIWVYEGGAATQLRAVSWEELLGGRVPTKPEVVVRARREDRPPPELRLAGDGAAPPRSGSAGEGANSVMLTEEELAMLLSPEPPAPPPRRPGEGG